jgi:hypothetical protein
MSTTTRNSPFKGQPKADGGDFKTEVPSEDTHDARVVALIDLGTHSESFKGEAEKKVRKCFLVFELDEEMTGMKGVNHVVGVRYTMSFHEKATLRKIAETILNDGQKFSGEVDYEELVGQPCRVQISHTVKTGEKGERTYANVGTISAVSKKQRDKVFAAKRETSVWYVGDSLDDLPDYLPRIYGEEAKDIIGRCLEVRGGGDGDSDPADEGDVDDGESLGSARNKPPF